MNEQNFKNHGRFVAAYHFIASAALLAILIGSIVNIVHSSRDNVYSASLILALTLVVTLLGYQLRLFPLKAQDRVIRAEENFRHFVLTGKPLDKRLTLSQIIALRFASDEEFLALAKKAVEEKLSAKQIKTAVQQWKADHHRM